MMQHAGADLSVSDDGQEAAGQVLTFRLGRAVFGIPVSHVREVLDVTPITPVANAPASLLGMVDVRHEAVPVVDVKHRLRTAPDDAQHGPETRIIVLEIGLRSDPQVIAVMADTVLEVVEQDNATLDPPPAFGERWDASFIIGIGRRGAEFMTVLDIDAIFGGDPCAGAA